MDRLAYAGGHIWSDWQSAPIAVESEDILERRRDPYFRIDTHPAGIAVEGTAWEHTVHSAFADLKQALVEELRNVLMR